MTDHARWSVSTRNFFFIGKMTGGWLTSGLLTDGHISKGTSTLGIATFMGLPPGSRAMWGSVPIIFRLKSQTRLAIFFLDMTHFLEVQVLLFSARFQVESDQELHVEHVDSLEQ